MFGPGTFIFGVLIPLAVVVLVAYGIWELVRSRDVTPSLAGGQGAAAPGPARTILDERFARGEIDVDEYVRRRALLDGSVPSPPVDVVSEAAPSAPPVVDGGVADTDVMGHVPPGPEPTGD